MKQCYYLVEFDIRSYFNSDKNKQHPICIYETYEDAKARVEKLFKENTENIKRKNGDKPYDEGGYIYEEHTAEWNEEKLNSDEEGYCYQRLLFAKNDYCQRLTGDEIETDMRFYIVKIEFHPKGK